MTPNRRLAIRAAVLLGEDAVHDLVEMLRGLVIVQGREPLSDGLMEHLMDLASAKATVQRVVEDLERMRET
jgi:hypothetical protein